MPDTPDLPTLLLTHPDCEKHEWDRHPEHPSRLRSVMARLNESGLSGEMTTRLATEIPLDALSAIHPAQYVEGILKQEPATGLSRVDADTYMSPGSGRAARLAAGACVEATREVLGGRFQHAFCAIRPPGHHAEVAAAMGFCLFNNVALAAETALTFDGINRVAIVDFDVHHCNGTVDIFKDRPEVLVCSSFQADFYPHRYLGYTNDHIINSPLAAGSSGPDFRHAIEQDWLPALDRHQPDLLFISAGFDAHEQDPLGGLNLLEADYTWVTGLLTDVADRHCQGRLVSTLEGGYNLQALASSVEAHVTGLIENA